MGKKLTLLEANKMLDSFSSLRKSNVNGYAYLSGNTQYGMMLCSWGHFDSRKNRSDYRLVFQKYMPQVSRWENISLEDFLDNVTPELQSDILFNLKDITKMRGR